jgi:DNA-directed RNA polymerase subunit H (RpoH/RPB5)
MKLKPAEVQELIKKYNISLSQLPKISSADPALPEGCNPGEVIKVERKEEDFSHTYFRVVV